jgi:hypothetical protein
LIKNKKGLRFITRVLESNPYNEYYLSSAAAFIMYNLEKDFEAKSYFQKALEINANLTSILTEKN